jgi:predicted nucleic-acid-binding protein
LLQDHRTLSREANKLIGDAHELALIVSDAIVAEVVYGLRQAGYARPQIADAVLTLIDIPAMAFENAAIIRRTILRYGQQGLDFADCYLLERALDEGYGLKTQDKKLHNTWIGLR